MKLLKSGIYYQINDKLVPENVIDGNGLLPEEEEFCDRIGDASVTYLWSPAGYSVVIILDTDSEMSSYTHSCEQIVETVFGIKGYVGGSGVRTDNGIWKKVCNKLKNMVKLSDLNPDNMSDSRFIVLDWLDENEVVKIAQDNGYKLNYADEYFSDETLSADAGYSVEELIEVLDTYYIDEQIKKFLSKFYLDKDTLPKFQVELTRVK